MKRIIFILFLAGLILGSISCETEMMDSSQTNDIPVIEAYLIPGKEIAISVNRPLPFSDDTSAIQEAISGLQIVVCKNDETYLLTDSTNPGIYSYNQDNLLVEDGDLYSMYFAYGTDTIK